MKETVADKAAEAKKRSQSSTVKQQIKSIRNGIL
jgi:hypothetical protein